MVGKEIITFVWLGEEDFITIAAFLNLSNYLCLILFIIFLLQPFEFILQDTASHAFYRTYCRCRSATNKGKKCTAD